MAHDHLTEGEIDGYLARSLTPAEIVRVLDHAGDCPACADRIAARRGNPVLLLDESNASSGASHVDEEELILLASGRLDPEQRGRVENHLGSCIECHEAVLDLQTFRRELENPQPLVSVRRRAVWLGWAIPIAASIALAFLIAPRYMRPSAPVLPKTAAYITSIRDGAGEIGLTASGQLTGLIPPGEESLVAQTLRTGTLPTPTQPLRAPVQGQLRGEADAGPGFQLRYPVADRVLSDQPDFEWTLLSGATGYQVKVFDTSFNQVAASGRIAETHWQPAKPLPRGQTYIWQVDAIRGGARIAAPVPPEPEARFQVVNQALADHLEQARTAKSHLLLAILYAREGLTRESLNEVEILTQLNPGSPLLDSLRRSLPADRRLYPSR